MTPLAVVPSPAPPSPSATTATQGYAFQRGDHVELAEATAAVLGVHPLTFAEGAYWLYDPGRGIWMILSGEEVRTTTASFAGSAVGKGKLQLRHTDIRGADMVLRDYLAALPGRPNFDTAIGGVAFANGFVRVQNGKVELTAHDPAHLARQGHPFDYLPGQPYPRLDAFFQDIFGDTDPSNRAELVALIQEFLGTCLIGDATRYQRCLVLFGEGGNGKSQVLEIARAVIPEGRYVSLPPQKWHERFQNAHLVGALANFVDEIPDRDITGGELFKSIITGEPVSAERKHQAPFEFRPRAGHVFSANTLPGTADNSEGYWRRFLLCPFTRDMTKTAGHRPDIAQEILAAERPAIVAWALEGAARVQRQGNYTSPKVSAVALAQWQLAADPVLRFVSTQCSVDPEAGIKPHDLYDAFSRWADRNGHSGMSSATFYRRLGRHRVPNAHTRNGTVYRLTVSRLDLC